MSLLILAFRAQLYVSRHFVVSIRHSCLFVPPYYLVVPGSRLTLCLLLIKVPCTFFGSGPLLRDFLFGWLTLFGFLF